MASSSASIAAGFLRASAFRLRLADDLRRIGIVPLPQRLVKEHKTHVLEGGSLFWRTVWSILEWLCFMPFMALLERRAKSDTSSTLQIASIWIAEIAGFVCLWHWVNFGMSLVFVVPFVAFATLVAMSASENLTRLAARWERAPLDQNFKAWFGITHHQLPFRLIERAESAMTIPGTRFEIEALNEDPILYAVRGWWIFADRVPIGAWETGTSLDHL